MDCLRKSEDLRHTRCAMEQSPNHPLEETRLRRVPQLERWAFETSLRTSLRS
jgi:hypothetical protein